MYNLYMYVLHLGAAVSAGRDELLPVGGADGSAQVGEEGISGELPAHIAPAPDTQG